MSYVLYALCFLGAYLFIMALYFKLRKLKSHSKFFAEGITILLIVLVNIIFRVIFMSFPLESTDGGNDPMYIVSKVLYAIYDTIGSFQFEGISDQHALDTATNIYLTYGLHLLTAFSVISVLASSISYEIYSEILLLINRFKRTFLRFKYQIYIFTALTEDTILLAKSIKEKHKHANERFIIIFAGTNLEPFSRKSILCLEVIDDSFLYLSVRKKKTQALVRTIHCHVNNYRLLEDKAPQSEVHFFAFDKELVGNDYVFKEGQNTQTVFNEIKALLNVQKNIETMPIINFYVLVAFKFEFASFERRFDQIILESHPDLLSDPEKHTQLKKVKASLPMNFISEADLTAMDFSKVRTKVLADKVLMDMNQEDLQYNALILGFGDNGKEILKQLYIDTSFVNIKGEECHFNGIVIDEHIKNKLGVFALNNPYFMIEELTEEEFYEGNIRTTLNNHQSRLSQALLNRQNHLNHKFYQNNGSHLNYPTLLYRNDNCTDFKFTKHVDHITGDFHKNIKQPYNTIVIALGNDQENITLANAYIADIHKELLESKGNPLQMITIAVHIRNKEYNQFVDWTFDSQYNSKYLNVIIFGNSKSIYCYDSILNTKQAQAINYAYSKIYDETSKVIQDVALGNNFEESFNGYINKIASERPNDIIKSSKALFKYLKMIGTKGKVSRKEHDFLAKKSWYERNLFEKLSNIQVLLYQDIMKHIHDDLYHQKDNLQTSNMLKEVYYLSNVEHIRWSRFHIASGWVYRKEQNEAVLRHNKKFKMHHCICKLDFVPHPKNLFDMINVAFAVSNETASD